jgi:hypothetical protein
MENVNRKSIYQGTLVRILLFGALAVCVAAGPVLAQDAIGGNFTLNENARFGNTVLSAGQYHFRIEPMGTIQSIRSIQEGAGSLVLVVVRPEKSGPTVSIFAMASASARGHEASALVLAPENQNMLAQTMYLEKEGLKVDFNWSSAKAKSQVAAQQVEPRQSAAGARTAGNY